MENNSEEQRSALIRLLMERSVAAHKRAATERKQIHLQEWAEKLGPTVLGEVDLCDTEIAGIATSLLKTGQLYQQPERSVELLQKLKVLSKPIVLTWAIQASSRFPNYVDYVCALELLRLTLLEVCLDASGCSALARE